MLSADTQKQILAGFSSFGTRGVALYNQLLEAVKVGLTSGIHNVFVLSTILMVVGFVAIFFLQEIPLRGKNKAASTQVAEDAEEGTVSVAMMH